MDTLSDKAPPPAGADGVRTLRILFGLFFVSGFCTILYQIVWLRLAFAAFGVVTPVLSLVLAVFMLGLAVGTWAAGRWIEPLARRTRVSPVFYYGIAEFLIGAGAFLVPRSFAWGQSYLTAYGAADSGRYLLTSAVLITLSLLPWCTLMGATLPLMLAFLRETEPATETSFSFLYLANVIGAMSGAAATAVVLVETLGFQATLLVAACGNFAIAAVSFALGARYRRRGSESGAETAAPARRAVPREPLTSGALICVILFTTGFASMALEVVWTRAFTPVLETTIYAFAALLTVYLLATWVGSFVYRADLARGRAHTTHRLVRCLAIFTLLPVVVSDPRLHASASLLLASIFPYCAVLGYLTPKLIDQYSAGSPRTAGYAYALNTAGCIVGPLLAGYVLLPVVGVRLSMILLAAPFLVFFAARLRVRGTSAPRSAAFGAAAAGLLLISLFVSRSYEDGGFYGDAVVRRDYTATVISHGEGMQKRMLVNGVGMTHLTSMTKVMAHLPLALHEKPASALVICFGMGTTFRSLMSWNIEVTAVELVPSVVRAFPYYFDDADDLLQNPRGRVVIDDGRRFLNRTDEMFDVVTLDPPPPVEAAGSSLLYSREFYETVKRRLNDGGIVQQWFPGGEILIRQAVFRSIHESFPYVRIFRSMEGMGWHMLASMRPIPVRTAEEMVARMPESARADLLEWFPDQDAGEILGQMLRAEKQMRRFLNPDASVVITDDRPFNEYFYLRRRYPGLL